MRKRAICVACGIFKKEAIAPCPECGYTPESEYEVARSLILSEKFTAGEFSIGRNADELKTIAEKIRQGRPYYFDPQEQEKVVNAYRRYPPHRSGALAGTVGKWLGLLLLVLVFLALLVWLGKGS